MSWLRVAGAAFKPGMKFLPRLVAKATPAAQGVARTLGSSYGARAGLGAGVGFLTGENAPGGRLGGAAIGAGLGAIPMHNFPGVPWLTTKGAAGLTKLGVAGPLAQNLAQAAIPGALIAGGSNLGGMFSDSPTGQAVNTIQQTGQNILSGGQNVGAGFLVQNLATGEQFLTGPQNALPGGMGQYGYTPPIGTQADQVDPTGLFSGRRTGTRLDARANAAALNILMPTVRKYAEQRAKDELTRQLAAAGVRQNITTNALLTELSARKDAEMGRKAAEQAGNAVTQNYATYQ